MLYTGKTKNLGIIGYPVAHSLSPLMQNFALAEAGLDYSYIAMPVRPEALSKAVIGLQCLGFAGFNVTIPHKITIMPFLDQVDEEAKLIGAVNTIVMRDGKMIGYNTDSVGFITALGKRGGIIEDKHAVLLGAGGAARAVIWGLISHGIRTLTLGVRNVQKAQPLHEVFAPYFNIEVFHWEEPDFQARLAQADLLINTTPLGMSPHTEAMPPVDWELISARVFVCDLIYTPERTRFLQMAEKNGNHVMNGEGMLVEQGAAAFKLWLGQDAATELMEQALHNMLSR